MDYTEYKKVTEVGWNKFCSASMITQYTETDYARELHESKVNFITTGNALDQFTQLIISHRYCLANQTDKGLRVANGVYSKLRLSSCHDMTLCNYAD